MKKVLCIALLATGCGQQTRLKVSMEGAGAQKAAVAEPPTGETVHRVLRSNDGTILFAYDLEANRTDAGLYRISLKPSQQKPTFEKARQVTVSGEETVRVDLMERPGTGQKITDVFSLTSEAPLAHLREMHDHVFRMIHGSTKAVVKPANPLE